MARKKKTETEEKAFTPSKYQQAIFDFIKNEEGSLVIEAVAGSGKTTTILKALDLIPEDKQVLFCAFNKDIVSSIKKKSKGYKNIEVRTIHGLGYIACTENIPNLNRKVNTTKYSEEYFNNISRYTSFHNKPLANYKQSLYRRNIFKLIDLGRLYLANSKNDIAQIAEYYSLRLLGGEIDAAYEIIEWGRKNITTIDYVDMIWYPNIFDFDLSRFSFDYIFVDEAQDISKAQREFILKCNNGKTRYFFVGDGHQSIYGFAAADPQSFAEIKKIDGINCLPLSVCYRCPQKVIDHAKHYVPEIEAKEDAINGFIDDFAKLSDIEDQDMVLCRYNSPLFATYVQLISQGKKAFILGKDIGKNMIDVIESTGQSLLNKDLKCEGVFSMLYRDYFVRRAQIMSETKETEGVVDSMPEMIAMQDTIFALEELSANIETTAQLIDKLSRIFSDEIAEGIVLSTIHKAKGLESNNVYIIENISSDRDKSRMTEWEEVQENNLKYVACTRPKVKLGFIRKGLACSLLPNRGLGGTNITQLLNQKELLIVKLDNSKNSVRLRPTFPSNGKSLGNTPRKVNNQLTGLIGTKKPRKTLF